MSNSNQTMTFKRYKNLPELAGICSMQEATDARLGVGESVDQLKRLHYALKQLHTILTARITGEPIYDLKTAFSYHAYLVAEHAMAIRRRVGEMREPPLGLEDVPHPALAIFFEEILAAPTTEALVYGIYEVAIPKLLAGAKLYHDATHPLADAPSRRVAKFLIIELEEILKFGSAAVAAIVTDAKKRELAPWRILLDKCLSSAGGLVELAIVQHRDGANANPTNGAKSSTYAETNTDQKDDVQKPDLQQSKSSAAPKIAESELPTRQFSKTPYNYERVPQRDERFQDSYNAGVNPEAFLYGEQFSPRDKTLMMYYKRLREIDVPEMMASIITETPNKPWGYYVDMSRQLWDEARHAMMGEVGFVKLGIDWTKIPINFTWSLNLNTQLSPIERHAVLYYIEQGLMPRTGKRFEWEVGTASGDSLSGMFQDFDWADEVLHARIGRDWYVKQYDTAKEAIDYGDQCWSKIVSHWRSYIDQGLTQHRNWWPEIYKAACEKWNVEPDPNALQFATTYETQRADLKLLSSSG